MDSICKNRLEKLNCAKGFINHCLKLRVKSVVLLSKLRQAPSDPSRLMSGIKILTVRLRENQNYWHSCDWVHHSSLNSPRLCALISGQCEIKQKRSTINQTYCPSVHPSGWKRWRIAMSPCVGRLLGFPQTVTKNDPMLPRAARNMHEGWENSLRKQQSQFICVSQINQEQSLMRAWHGSA